MNVHLLAWFLLLVCFANLHAEMPVSPLELPAIDNPAYHNQYGKFPSDATEADHMIAEWLKSETRAIAVDSLRSIQTLEDWTSRKDLFRRQLFEMLSLDPLPERTDLKAEVTGTIERGEIVVEKIHFQSRPGLYVTGNLYRPKTIDKPLPTILYLCGHGQVKVDGVSYGNKVAYQHHGSWFARNGYVCFIIDSVQLGEIEGIHHGTHREKMWWWNSRGYTSAGTEAWNCVRALDYLQSRPEVDAKRFGVTGRSGGGAYSWWTAALDDRIQVACPVAGITDLQTHVVDGCVEGHCDCMYMVNTYRWDYAQVAALVAPRPLLILNTDKDNIFPLSGVTRLHSQVRNIYDLHDASDKLGLVITEGPHKDTPELQVPVMRWFNKWLKNDEAPLTNFAEKLFQPAELKVFAELPKDEITSRCYENFTKLADHGTPQDAERVLNLLREKTFGAWPREPLPVVPKKLTEQTTDGLMLSVYELETQPGISLKLYLTQPVGKPIERIEMELLAQKDWEYRFDLLSFDFESAIPEEIKRLRRIQAEQGRIERDVEFESQRKRLREPGVAKVYFAPRCVGMTELADDEKYRTHVRRRFMLVGATQAGMQVWDTLRAVEATVAIRGDSKSPIHLSARDDMAVVATFAGLYTTDVSKLTLVNDNLSTQSAPDFLNWLRIATPEQLLTALRTGTEFSKVSTFPTKP